jgi:cobalt-zinc-cadmium resistance protein CzcA
VLEANNRNDGAGRLNEGEEALLVRAEGAIRPSTTCAPSSCSAQGRAVRVGDVAEVRIGSLTRYGAVTRDGAARPCRAWCSACAAPMRRKVVAGVKARLAEIAQPARRASDRPFYDRSELVERAVGTVSKALIEAIVLVLVLLLLFLGNLRAALVVALMLPLSALATFMLMRFAGLSANLMSLGGLAIAIGMLVDAAVVVVENVVQPAGARGGQPADAAPRLPRRARGGGAGGLGHPHHHRSCSCRCSPCRGWKASCSCRWR